MTRIDELNAKIENEKKEARKIKANIDLLQEQVKLEEEKEKKNKRWKPNNGEKYWYISWECAFWSIWNNNFHDQNLYNCYNIFKTREDAIEILKAVKNVLKVYQLGILISPNKDFDVETRLLFDNPDEQIKAIKIFKEEF